MEYNESREHRVDLSREDVEEAIRDLLRKRECPTRMRPILAADVDDSKVDVELYQTYDEPATFSCQVTWSTDP